MEKMDKLRSWQNKIPPHISRHLSTKSFVEDSVSPILHIISPPTLRPVIYLHLFTASFYQYTFILSPPSQSVVLHILLCIMKN